MPEAALASDSGSKATDAYKTAFYQAMSPSLLAKQPVIAKNDNDRENPAWTRIFSHLESRLLMLKNWRWSWWTHWSRLAEYFLPRRYVWLVVANRMWRGAAINDAILDSTGVQAVRTCAAGLWTGLTSPSRPWFALGAETGDDELAPDAKEWIEDTQKKLEAVFQGSNFYTAMAQFFQDVTVFGTSPVIMYEDFEDVLRCYVPAAGEYYLGAGARLSIDVHNREFTLTVSQIVEQFGVENCPTAVKLDWQEGGGRLDKEYVIAHSIEPNFAIFDKAGGSIQPVPSEFPWREIYWMRGEKSQKPLSVKGFNSKPFIVGRWSTTSNDAYGRSPCMDELGDNKQLQTETLRKAEYIEKGIRPPMVAGPEMQNQPQSIVPGQVTYVTGDGNSMGFKPAFMVEPAWLAGITADIVQLQQRIKDGLFVSLFMAITQMEGVQPRNELELTKRDLERLQELGPFITMFENEGAGPAVMRALDIAYRAKILKPVPQSLRGVQLRINFVSILRLAQSAAQSVSMKDVLQMGGELSLAAKGAGLPDPLRIVNLDQAYREYMKLAQFPTNCTFTVDQVETHDQAREKAQQAAQAPQALMAGVQAAQALSSTQMGGNTALSALTGGGGGPQ